MEKPQKVPNVIGVFSSGILRISNLQNFFEEPIIKLNRFESISDCDKLAGWGKKKNTILVQELAAQNSIPYISLEDGFLRSVSLGVNDTHPFSLVIDDVGIYYDANLSSKLENLIIARNDDSQAAQALNLIKKFKLSKYNHAPDLDLPAKLVTRVLVIDQTLNDVSVKLGGADETLFNEMLKKALEENPQSEILVKTHPDVLSGHKKGYLTQVPNDPRIKLFAENISPLSLLEQVDKVYVVTSQMGFEALMLNKPVICFGLPWYAGWGLTDDRHPDISKLKVRRYVNRTVEELFTAAYLRYPRYLNPITKKAGTIFDVIHYLAQNKEKNNETRGEIYCLGMSLWKRDVMTPFLKGPSNRLRFVKSEKKIPKGAQVISWGVKYQDKSHWRMEDGFLRSVGLGSDLIRPISLVLDKNGIYYDPFSGSDLERILQTQNLDQEDLERARSFKESYVRMKVSKYNLGKSDFKIDPKGKKVILVPGQVEDDASILRGSPIVKTNQALLDTVRKLNPEAYLIFKPHPDVVVGNRKGQLKDPSVADIIVTDANIIDCIEACDELHTMTSLSGFEALLHGKTVHCYGGPFYAGWGLTIDHMELPHRTRKVTIDELVFGAFLKYPRYALPGVEGVVRAEDALAWISERLKNPELLQNLPKNNTWLAQKKRRVRYFFQMVLDVFRPG